MAASLLPPNRYNSERLRDDSHTACSVSLLRCPSFAVKYSVRSLSVFLPVLRMLLVKSDPAPRAACDVMYTPNVQQL